MADITFAQIEAAMVTRLDSQLSYLKQCASYAGEIERANDGLPVESPACFVTFDGFVKDASRSSLREHVGDADFSVVVFARSFVGDHKPRIGTRGAYAIISDVIAALDDHDLDLTGFNGCSLNTIESVMVNQTLAVYRVKFTADMKVTR